MDGCSKPCTPAGITCCDSIWIPSLTIPNVVLYPQDRYQTESIFFFGDYSTDASAVDRESIVEGTFSSPFTFQRFPFDTQVLRLVVAVEGSGEFYLVGSNSGRQSEQGGGQLGGGGGTYVNDEVTGWKITSVALNCTPADTTVSSSASYHPEDPWNAVPDSASSSSSSSGGAGSNQSATCIFTIHIQRTSGVYVIAVLLPVILSVYLTFTAFIAKPEDLEIRLGACLTLFLALVAIQFVIDSQPSPPPFSPPLSPQTPLQKPKPLLLWSSNAVLAIPSQIPFLPPPSFLPFPSPACMQLPRTSAITNFGYLMIVSYIVIWLCTMENLIAFCIAERIEKNVQELVQDALPPALVNNHSAADKAAGEKLMGGGGEGVEGVDSNDPEAIAEAAAERRAAAAEEKQKKNVPGLLVCPTGLRAAASVVAAAAVAVGGSS
ncbi:unnamed protein product [Closterium sp. NIES-65]|nr:unnamed protein product [Closterium sp. NIES-65]